MLQEFTSPISGLLHWKRGSVQAKSGAEQQKQKRDGDATSSKKSYEKSEKKGEQMRVREQSNQVSSLIRSDSGFYRE